MGWLSKTASSIKGAVKRVASGVKKVFKKVTSSKIGKIVMIGAAIYLGGAALGAWSIPGQSAFAMNVNGAWTAAGSQASQLAAGSQVGTVTAGAGVDTAAGITTSESLMGVDAAAGELSMEEIIAQGAAEGSTALSNIPLGQPEMYGMVGSGNLSPTVDPTLTETVVGGAKSAGKWAMENPLLTAVGVHSISNAAAADDQRKAEKEQREYEEYERDRMEKRYDRNMDVSHIRFGTAPRSSIRETNAGNPSGFINSRIRG